MSCISIGITFSDAGLIKAKIAAAVCVIRNKPENVNIVEYTKQLCDNYQQSQRELRCRYIQAQDHVVLLKQQLFLLQNKLTSGKSIN